MIYIYESYWIIRSHEVYIHVCQVCTVHSLPVCSNLFNPDPWQRSPGSCPHCLDQRGLSISNHKEYNCQNFTDETHHRWSFPKTEGSWKIPLSHKEKMQRKNQKRCHLGMPLISYFLQLRGHRRNLSNVQQWPPHRQNVTSSPWLNRKTWHCRDEGVCDQLTVLNMNM